MRIGLTREEMTDHGKEEQREEAPDGKSKESGRQEAGSKKEGACGQVRQEEGSAEEEQAEACGEAGDEGQSKISAQEEGPQEDRPGHGARTGRGAADCDGGK
ncbi:MAG TPA: hypothetical protein VKG05_10490 [Steroidobacteraceae bacterium]|nr:hypothetical protein [Steroidobacteraceae bacterium]